VAKAAIQQERKMSALTNSYGEYKDVLTKANIGTESFAKAANDMARSLNEYFGADVFDSAFFNDPTNLQTF
jgi:hypothetical protein